MIRVGPSGWTHPRLADVWPIRRGPTFDPLAFLAGHFGCIEVDITAHAVPRPQHVTRWKSALAEAPERTRLLVKLPLTLGEFARPVEERRQTLEATAAALRPLLGRDRLGALVLTLGDGVLHGAAETRWIAGVARAFSGAPLVLEAAHPSWYESRALDAVGGAGWSLAHVEPPDRWDAPPRRHRPTGPIGMLRLLAPGQAPPPVIGALARRARALQDHVREVFVVTAGPIDPAAASMRLASALELRFVLAGERPVPAWPELVAAHPHLAPLVLPDEPAN